jgi:GMP synthase-like glutamine amidotransferase
MILVVNVCSEKLSRFEFVKPVEEIVRKANMDFFTEEFMNVNDIHIRRMEKTIICGTALKDFNYLKDVDKFEWIRGTHKPILGICAGMQVLARLFDGDIISSTRIGRYKVKTILKNSLCPEDEFFSYFLSSRAVEPGEEFETLGESGDLSCIIKHKRESFYGCLFHPEVLNPQIITSFLQKPAP